MKALLRFSSLKFVSAALLMTLTFSATRAQASELSMFLKSCAYGTAAGAIVGLGLVALSEDPSDNMNTVARGASLGLYAGMGYGLYTLSNSSNPPAELTQSSHQVWFTALQAPQKGIVGAQINWANFSF